MSRQLADTRRLSAFYSEVYGDMTSVREVLRILGRSGEPGSVKAADLYTRSLDCQNHGVLDVGCGVGGPGRFLADRYGCRVIGVDVLPERVKGAEALSKLTGLARQLSYRQADATALPFRDAFPSGLDAGRQHPCAGQDGSVGRVGTGAEAGRPAGAS